MIGHGELAGLDLLTTDSPDVVLVFSLSPERPAPCHEGFEGFVVAGHVELLVAGAIGEWNYYVLGSAIEVALLGAIAYYAWSWPKETGATIGGALGASERSSGATG